MYNRILVPIDLADPDLAKPAIETAVMMANSSNGTLRLIHVLPITPAMLVEYVPADFDAQQRASAEDAMKIVANGVNHLIKPDNAIVLVTHYQRLLNYIMPDYVHVIEGGQIVKTGGEELALELERRGYDWVRAEFDAARAAA